MSNQWLTCQRVIEVLNMTSYANTRLAILLICIASILLPIVVLAALPYRLRENYDGDFHAFYEPVAQNLLDGKGLVTPKNEFASRWPPGYPLILAGVFALGRGLGVGEAVAVQAFSILSSTLAAVLIYLVARGPFGTRVALLAALLWVTYPHNSWLTVQRLSEQPFLVVLLVIVFALLEALESQRPRHGLGFSIGVLVGIAALIRPIALALGAPLILMPWLARTGWTSRGRLIFCWWLLLGNLVALAPGNTSFGGRQDGSSPSAPRARPASGMASPSLAGPGSPGPTRSRRFLPM